MVFFKVKGENASAPPVGWEIKPRFRVVPVLPVSKRTPSTLKMVWIGKKAAARLTFTNPIINQSSWDERFESSRLEGAFKTIYSNGS